jgi:hypothetical protein
MANLQSCMGSYRQGANLYYRLILLALLPLVIIGGTTGQATAHGGGTPQLTNVAAGPYRLYAWSTPEPWRVGEVHLSIAVTQAASGDQAATGQIEVPVTDVAIEVTFTQVGANRATAVVSAAPQALINEFYYEADTNLPTGGRWEVTVHVAGTEGSGSATFEVDVLPASTVNWGLIGGAAIILLAILALALVWSRQPSVAAQSAQRSSRRSSGSTTPE